MRINLFSVISLIILLAATGCKDESEDPKLKVSKVELVYSSMPEYPYTYYYSYTNGMLSGFKTENKEGTYKEATFLYTGKLLNEINELSRILGSEKVTHHYDSKDQLASSTVYSPGASDWILSSTYYYDNKGRVNRIDANLSPSTSVVAHLLEYDNAGNIVQVQRRYAFESGELSEPIATTKITYDNKKNPYYKLGSPAYDAGFIVEELHSFIIFISPSNPVSIEVTNSRNSKHTVNYSYKYNEKGYPTELEVENLKLKFDYTIN